MPNFARLAARGSFAPLGTTIPPQSPVAWSTFITGLDPGGHGIFDFIHRDPETLTPYPVDVEDRRRRPHAHARQVAGSAVGRQRRAAAAGPAVLGGARRARHRDDDHPHAGQLPAVGHGDARAERHGHAGHPRHLRHVLVLHLGAVRVRRPARSAGGVVYAGRRRRAAPCARALEGPDNPFLVEPEKVRARVHRVHRRQHDSSRSSSSATRSACCGSASGATGCPSSSS